VLYSVFHSPKHNSLIPQKIRTCCDNPIQLHCSSQRWKIHS